VGMKDQRVSGAATVTAALVTRAANAGMFSLFLDVCPDEASSYPFGREPDGAIAILEMARTGQLEPQRRQAWAATRRVFD